MSEMSAIENIVALSVDGDAAQVKAAINDALQQKVMVTLENKKKEVATSFLHKDEEAEQESEEVENGWFSNKSKINWYRNENCI